MPQQVRLTLSEQDLRDLLNDYLRHGPPTTPDALPLILAAEVATTMLGWDWAKRNIHAGQRNPIHFRFDQTAAEIPNYFVDRLLALAEMLYAFQHVPGFSNRLESLRTCDIEAAVGELEGARLLHRAGICFSFVTPQGAKRSDFDVLIPGPPEDINCEMKAKAHDTELSVSTLEWTLRKARSQLPPEQPAIVFVKLPQAWPLEPALAAVVDEALEKFFRGTQRVAGVVFHWETWIDLRSAQVARVTSARVARNLRSPHHWSVGTRVFDFIDGLEFLNLSRPVQQVAQEAGAA